MILAALISDEYAIIIIRHQNQNSFHNFD